MTQEEKSRYLGEEKIPKLMLKFSIPCVLSLLVTALYNIVDQIFIGNSELSTLGNAATGIVFPLFIIGQAVAWCFGDGCAAYLNICQGRNDSKHAHKAIGACMTVTLIISFLLMAVFYPLKTPILYLFGASESTISYATEYFNVILAFIPFYMLASMLNGIIRADGSPAYAMISLSAGAILNIILDPLFIFGFKWGMFGAALATAISQFVAFLVSASYFFHAKTFTLHKDSFIPRPKYFLIPFKYGFSILVTQLSILLIAVLNNILLSKYGGLSKFGSDIPIAVVSIESKVFSVVIQLVVGIILGCQPIISYNMGAKNYKRVKKLYSSIFLCTVVISAVSTFIIEVFPHAVVSMFGTPTNIPNPEDYWEFACRFFRIYLMLLIFNCLIKLNSMFLQAAGSPTKAIIASMIRDIICFIPLVIILPNFIGIDGILYAAPIADFIAMLVSGVIIVKFLKNLGKEKVTEICDN